MSNRKRAILREAVGTTHKGLEIGLRLTAYGPLTDDNSRLTVNATAYNPSDQTVHGRLTLRRAENKNVDENAFMIFPDFGAQREILPPNHGIGSVLLAELIQTFLSIPVQEYEHRSWHRYNNLYLVAKNEEKNPLFLSLALRFGFISHAGSVWLVKKNELPSDLPDHLLRVSELPKPLSH
ncbi:MAG: hypothetical protein ABID61_01145 [Candidatus Micrarchaeota archaeon]